MGSVVVSAGSAATRRAAASKLLGSRVRDPVGHNPLNRDLIQNSTSNEHEAMMLAETSVTEISLTRTASGAISNGNMIKFIGNFTHADGRAGIAQFASFASDQHNTADFHVQLF